MTKKEVLEILERDFLSNYLQKYDSIIDEIVRDNHSPLDFYNWTMYCECVGYKMPFEDFEKLEKHFVMCNINIDNLETVYQLGQIPRDVVELVRKRYQQEIWGNLSCM